MLPFFEDRRSVKVVCSLDAVWSAATCHAPIVVSQFRNKSDVRHTIIGFGVFDEIAGLGRI